MAEPAFQDSQRSEQAHDTAPPPVPPVDLSSCTGPLSTSFVQAARVGGLWLPAAWTSRSPVTRQRSWRASSPPARASRRRPPPAGVRGVKSTRGSHTAGTGPTHWHRASPRPPFWESPAPRARGYSPHRWSSSRQRAWTEVQEGRPAVRAKRRGLIGTPAKGVQISIRLNTLVCRVCLRKSTHQGRGHTGDGSRQPVTFSTPTAEELTGVSARMTTTELKN